MDMYIDNMGTIVPRQTDEQTFDFDVPLITPEREANLDVTVDARTLLDYKAFQAEVLHRTGQLFYGASLDEYPYGGGRNRWMKFIAQRMTAPQLKR